MAIRKDTTGVTVTDSDSVVLAVENNNASGADVCLWLTNQGATALNDVKIQVSWNSTAGNYVDYITDMATPSSLLTMASATIETLGAGATAFARFNVGAAPYWRVVATVAAGSTTVDAHIGAQTM